MKSLCGNTYGCMSAVNNAVGTELDWNGEHLCGGCVRIAISFLEFAIGDTVEWVVNEWVPKSKVMDKLESMILWQALKPQIEALHKIGV